MDNQQFTPQGQPQFAAPEQPKVKKPSPFKNPAFIKRFVILVIAVVVLIGSILPTVSYKIEYFKEETVSVKISPFRSITLMFDSFVNHDTEELADSLFAETSEAKMEVWSELLGRVDKDDLTARQKNIVAKMFFLVARGEIRTDESRAWATFAIAALSSIAYIVFAIIFLINAIKSLNGFFKGEGESRNAALMLCAVPFAASLKLFAVKTAMYEVFAGYGGAAGFGVVISIVLSCLAILGIVAFAVFFEGRRFSLKRDVSRLAMLVVLVFTAFTVAMPLMTMKVTGYLGDSDKDKTARVKFGSEFFGSLDISDDERSDMIDRIADAEFFTGDENKSWYSSYYDKDGDELDPEDCLDDNYGYLATINSFASYSQKEYKSGEYQSEIDEKIELIYLMSGGMWNCGLMNLIPTLSFIALLAICYLAWKQTWVVVSNENKPAFAKLDKVIAIAAAVCALLILIFTIIFISTTLGDIREYLGRRAPKNVHVAFKLSLGLAPILTLLLTGAIAALPFVPVATNMLGGFENAQPNISFAPLFKKKNPAAQQSYAPAPEYKTPDAAPAPQSAAYAAGELKQYKELLDAGVITQDDFDAKKAQILNIPSNQ